MNPRHKIILSIVLLNCLAQSISAAEMSKEAVHCPLTSMDLSHQYNLQEFKGKVVYVDFWASWCPPCLKSFPFMNTLEQDLNAQGLQVIAINLDENIEDAEKFLANFPAKFTVAADPEKQCAKNFKVKAMPSSYLIDRNGIIRHIHLGFRAGEAQQLRKQVELLLAENNAATE